jgi:pimeloyl-ACP methyl ester carboxylesterase
MTTATPTPRAQVTRTPPVRVDGRSSVVTGTRPSLRWVRVGTALAGAGLLVLVAHDGSPGWQAARGLAVVALTLLALAASADRPAGRGAGVLAVAGGALLLPVGLAVAAPHLIKGGPALVTVAGVLTFVGALVLLVAGSAALLRRTTRWVKVPVVLVIVAVNLLTASVLVPAVASTNVPPTAVGDETPADLGIAAHREVTFRAADGVQLSGWYVPSTNGAAVALLHGAGSTRSDTLRHAAVLADHGYGVLLYDARGHGRSEGRAMDLGWTGESDVSGALTFLARQPDVDPGRLGVVGLSMGGEVAVGASARDGRIAAVVAEGATGRSADDKDWYSDVHGWRGRVQEGIEHLQTLATDVLTAAGPPVELREAVAASGRPTLLVAAGAVADEGDAARHIREGSPGTVEVWTVDGAGHTGGLGTDPDAWEDRVVGFLDEHLQP